MSSLPPPYWGQSQSVALAKARHNRDDSQARYAMGKQREALEEEWVDEPTRVRSFPMGKDEFKKRFAVKGAQKEQQTVKKRQPSRMMPFWEEAAVGSARFAVRNPFESTPFTKADASNRVVEEEESEMTVGPRKAIHRVPRMNSLEDFFSQMTTEEVEMEVSKKTSWPLPTILEVDERLEEADELSGDNLEDTSGAWY